MSDAYITKLKSDHTVGKKFWIGDDGTLQKGQITNRSGRKLNFVSGSAETITAPSAAALAQIIEDLRPRDLLCTGRLRDGRSTARVTTIGKRQGDDVARSVEYFGFPPSQGWLLIDHDTKAMPPDVAKRVEELGGGVAALESIWPELKDAARVFKPSSSGGVYIDGQDPAEATGFHLFVGIADVSRSKEALLALEARAWDAGLAWYVIGTAGQRLQRSIVDATVGSPERLIFTAPPVLGKGVRRVTPPINVTEGAFVDIPAMPTSDMWLNHRDTAFKAHEPEAIEQTAKAQNVDVTTATKIVREGRAGGVLGPLQAVWLRDGSTITVDALIRSVTRPVARLALPDPFEGPSYNPTAASLFWGADYKSPIIISHAHGEKIVYRLQSLADAVWSLKPRKLPSRRMIDLKAALRACEGEQDLPVILAVAVALTNRIPHAMGLDDLQQFLDAELPDNIDRRWIPPMIERVAKIVNKRRENSLAEVKFSVGAMCADRVDHRFVDGLSPLEQIEGVTIVRAPMGSGKTQRIGGPFVDAAKAAADGQTVWAIAHRQTLISELATRLNLTDYRRKDIHGDMLGTGGLAVCLPSITRHAIRDLDSPAFLFIDEVKQVLEFLTSQSHCRTRDGTAKTVFDELVKLVRHAKGVLVADAQADDTVIAFLRYCRPDDTIHIVEMREPADAKINAIFYANGNDARDTAVDDIMFRVAMGQKAWIACESAKTAQDVGAFLGTVAKVLVVDAETKHEPAQARFFNDPEAVSREYDVIVASPVISSGLSIEHAGDPHFDFGAIIASGTAITPSVAAQQLRRVRYLREFIIACTPNNRIGGQTAEAIIEGKQDAAKREGREMFAQSFDRLVTRFQAKSANARADFAAGLWWQLEASGWSLTRAVSATDGEFAGLRGDLVAQRKAARAEALIAACKWLPHMVEGDVDLMRRMHQDAEQRAVIEAWDLTRALGVDRLTVDDVEFIDDGGLLRMDLFEDLTAAQEDLLDADDRAEVLSHRSLRQARRMHLRMIFEGVDVTSSKHWLDRDVADKILDRIMEHRTEFAASGAIPPKYRARFGAKGRELDRPANPIKAVQEILLRAGLGFDGKQVSVSREASLSINGAGGSRDRIRVFTVDKESWNAMKKRLDQRVETTKTMLKMVRDAPERHTCALELSHPAQISTLKHLENIEKRLGKPVHARRVRVELDPDLSRKGVAPLR